MNAPAVAALPTAPAAAPAPVASRSMSDFGDLGDTPIPTDAPPPPPRQREERPATEEVPDETQSPDVEPPEAPDEDDLLSDEPPEQAAVAATEAAQKWKDLEGNPELPAELGEKLWTVKNGDREWQVPINELAKGYQRLSESTRRAQELDSREGQVAQNEGKFQRFFESIREPQNFLEVFERQLGPETFDKVMELRAQRDEENQNFIQAAGYAAMKRLGVNVHDPRVREAMLQAKARLDRDRVADIDRRKLEAKNRELESHREVQDSNKQVAQLQEVFRRQLAQLVPTALKAARIRDNVKNRDRHLDNVRAVMKATGSREITRDVVQQAAKILREELEDEAAAKRTATAKTPTPTRAGIGAGQAPTRGQAAAGKSRAMRDFDDLVNGS